MSCLWKEATLVKTKPKLSTCKETKICVKRRLTLELLKHSLQLQNFQNMSLLKIVNGIFNIWTFNIFILYHWLLQGIVVQVRNFKKQQSKTCLRFSLRHGSLFFLCCHTHCEAVKCISAFVRTKRSSAAHSQKKTQPGQNKSKTNVWHFRVSCVQS